jgi:hypothetical protein
MIPSENITTSLLVKPHNGGVDAAARIHSSIAGSDMMRNTLPPLASNDLLGVVPEQTNEARRVPLFRCHVQLEREFEDNNELAAEGATRQDKHKPKVFCL